MNLDKTKLDGLKIDRGAPEAGRSRTVWLAAVVAIAIVAVALFLLASRRAVPAVEVTPAEQLSSGGSETLLNASGYVTARRQATVSSKITGKVTEVHVEEGMVVREGALLARLDDSMARKGLVLAESRSEAAAKALAETQVRIRQARLDHDRVARLAEGGVSSLSDVDRAKAELDSLEARLVVQQQELDVARREVALRGQEVEDSEIRAPFAGIVVSKNAQPGEMISPMSSGGFTRTGICTIVDMESLEIEVDVGEAYITRVKPEQRVEAILDAYPEWKIASHVITIIPTADRQKATVKVRIGFDERDARVLPDMGVKVAFIGAGTEGAAPAAAAVSIPSSALRRDGERDVVFVVKDGRAERRAVKVGGAEGTRVRVLSGLSAGEAVVVSGPAELEDGDAVRVASKKEGA